MAPPPRQRQGCAQRHPRLARDTHRPYATRVRRFCLPMVGFDDRPSLPRRPPVIAGPTSRGALLRTCPILDRSGIQWGGALSGHPHLSGLIISGSGFRKARPGSLRWGRGTCAVENFLPRRGTAPASRFLGTPSGKIAFHLRPLSAQACRPRSTKADRIQ